MESTPAALRELAARLARLRAGVADLEPVELAAAIGKVEGKRRTLLAAETPAKASAQLYGLLPKAAAAYRAQIEAGE